LALDIAPERPAKEPRAYLLTFTCYGVKLHGDPRGSVDRKHPPPLGRYYPENARRVGYERKLMTHQSVSLDAAERATALNEILRTCAYEGWQLHAAHVRSAHIHIVATASRPPEDVMRELKAYLTRTLNDQFGRREKRWARHGSTVWLWDDAGLDRAVSYVVRDQGEPMALYVNPNLWPEYLDALPT
jgi:REP element-mobilizing transposase RayT